MTTARGLAVLAFVAVSCASGLAGAGHEVPFYPSFYPQEIRIEAAGPAAAARLLAKSALHAYVGASPAPPPSGPARLAWAESLRSYVVLTFNRASAAFADGRERCAAAARLLPALAAGRGDWRFHPYPVTPWHDDYLHHFDLVEAAARRAAEPRAAGPALRIRATGRAAELLRGVTGVRPAGREWDAQLEEVELRDLLARHGTQLDGWLGPPWLRAGWFQAHAIHASGVADPAARAAIEETLARRLAGGFASAVERINLERRLVTLLTRGCERVAVGYTLRREALNDDYSEGVENVGVDGQTGLNAGVFLRTVKLKDFPWNGWLRLGVAARPAAAWNPIAGFSDEGGRLIWTALADPALLPAPWGGGWIANRVQPQPPVALAGAGAVVPRDALVLDPAGSGLRAAASGVTARQKIAYRVLLSKFHDGTKMTVADLVYPFAFAARWSARDPEIARATALLRERLAAVKVVVVGSEIKDYGDLQLIYEIPQVEVYLTHALDPADAVAVAPPWSAVPWQLVALMEEAVTRGLAAFSETEARRRGVPWLDLARDKKLQAALAALLDDLERRTVVPEALRGLVTVEQAKQRWAALRRFHRTQGHFLVTSGPYQLSKWSAGAAVLGVFRDLSYPNPVGMFDRYAFPLRAWITKAERRGDRLELQADAEKVSKFERSYKIVREPVRLEPTGEKPRDTLVARFAVVNTGDEVVAAGQAHEVERGRLIVDLRDKLAPGAYRIALALALNGNLLSPEVKVVPYRVGD
ncbi:MAG: hypothetical protein HYU26_15955 [Candidatus Rokubacteria bacterium]|nr:hypothetical protein [Candidatus Rokubacteria bacterium]